MTTTTEALSQRITDYLSGGGLFNPELANHDAVRDLLIECRDAFASPAPAQPTLTDEQIKALMPAPNVFERDRDDGWSEDRVIEVVRAALATLQAPVPAPEPTRSQRLRDAGYTRRPSWKSLPSDDDDQSPAEGDAVPWSKTVESVSLLLNRATQWPIDDCENFAATIIRMVNAQPQPKGTLTDEQIQAAFAEHDAKYSLVSSMWSFEAGVRFAEAQGTAGTQAPAPAPSDERLSWQDYQGISDLPAVDEAIRNLLEDQTEDNSVCMVRAVIEAAADRLRALVPSPAVGAEPPRRLIDDSDFGWTG